MANLTNNKDVFMCIFCFHARLQHYKTLLKELNAHPESDPVPPDKYEVERVALADRNLNVPCKSGLRFPSLMVMLDRWKTQSKVSVFSCLVLVHTELVYDITICMYIFVCTSIYNVHTCVY